MLTIASCLWDANENSQPFSRGYDESWVEKLHRGFARNLTVPFRSLCFTDRPREFSEPVDQVLLSCMPATYGSLIEPFRTEGPLIVCGLDMIVVGNVDKLAEYCETRDILALPQDPYEPQRSINPIALVPKGYRHIFTEWRGQNDMEHLRRYPWLPIDKLWPGWVISLKYADVRRKGTQGARIVYFHGNPKPNELPDTDWVKEHWR